jgi:4-alpha-glucanotransferase
MSEAQRTGTVIVGEDLGTVPKYVPQAMNRHGIRRMYVVQYELPKLDAPQRESIASINTHDMPTFAGFWHGKDIDERVERDLLDKKGAAEERKKREQMREKVTKFLKARGLLTKGKSETIAKTPSATRSQPRDGEQVTRGDSLRSELTIDVLDALQRWLASSDAEFVLINLEDCWLEEEPQNRPGMPERSWRRKMRKSLEEARNDRTVVRLLQGVNEERHGK